MVRRPHSQLVEQGIIPPLKTSPAIHEQCKQLERAKTSDLLKAKIQQRPNREDLERRHILEEDECHIDPSLAEKQRMLKKARLADQLNSQIQHRPGPLELIKKNILHTEKPIEKIVKEGLVSFKATSEGLLTRPQHPHSYVTYEDDSQSSESDTRQTPPRADEQAACDGASDALQVAAASAGIVTVALTIPTSGGQVVVTSAPILQSSAPALKVNAVPPPPPPPPPAVSIASSVQVKQETANLFEELCQSVAGPSASPGGSFLSMVSSPASLTSTTSTLSPLSSIASPPQTLTSLPPLSCQLSLAKSDAPGKEKNRKKSKSKPACKARTIKFHEYKGPPNASQKLSSESSQPEETSYQLMLEQQNCLLKFLETLNKNQSIVPAASAAAASSSNNASANGGLVTTVAKSNTTAATTAATATKLSTALPSPAPATPLSNVTAVSEGASSTASPANSTFSIISTPRPPPLPSPALSVTSSIPPSPATSYAESTCSVTDISRLEKMKVSDLKMHLKRRNLPVSGPKPQLIERLKPYLPLDVTECSTIVNTPASTASSEMISTAGAEAMDATNTAISAELPVPMIVNSPHPAAMSPERRNLEHEQMDIVQQVDSPRPVPMQTILQPKPQAATIILTNDDLVREQKRQIDELQRQLQRSQQELQQMRQKQQQNSQQQKHLQHPQQQTVTAQVVNALPTQQITLITTTTAPHCAPLAMLPQIKENITLPATKVVTVKSHAGKANASNAAAHKAAANSNTTAVTPQAMSQKMVVKQQLEAKIQKQKQAAAAAAAAAQAQAQQQHVQQVQAQALAQAQAQAQLRLLTTTQKTQTLLIPTVTTAAATPAKLDDMKKLPNAARQKNSNNNAMNKCNTNAANTNNIAGTTTILANQIPLTAKTHNNLGLVWNEGNQTIFLVGLNDQHMTAHTIGNISLANASPATKKLLNGHQRTSSLPSILFPIATPAGHEPHHQLIEAKPVITQQQLQQLQLQQQQQQQQYQNRLFQPTQQIIQLDIKPHNLPPPPPPPPQYEEATKQLAAKANLAQIKIKEEPNTGRNTPHAPTHSVTTQTTSKRKNPVKSEKVTNVLDILVKQGDLPESVLEPITPVTPLTPGGSNALMTDMSGNLIFSPNANLQTAADVLAASGALVPKQEPRSSPMPESTMVTQPMDTTPSGQQQQQQQAQRDIDSVFQLLSGSGNDMPSNAINSPLHSGFIDNIDMASPLQPDAHIDAESVAKTLDIFLEQHHSTPPPQASTPGLHLQQQHQSPTHHDMLSKASNSPEKVVMPHNVASPNAKLNHFDEFELFELMSQQLEMDIGDDASNFTAHGGGGGLNPAHQQHLHHSSGDGKSANGVDAAVAATAAANVATHTLNGLRRDMNPSLQPSINELIQQQLQQQQQQQQSHQQSQQQQQQYQQLQHNNCARDVLSVADVDFDADSFVAQLAQVSEQEAIANNNNNNNLSHNHSILSGNAGSPHNNNNCNGSEVSNSGDSGLNLHDSDTRTHSHNHSHSDNHFNATPMDVCDDFDNPLGSFSFAAFSPDSNINTPPHPFGSGDSGSGGGMLNGGCLVNGESSMGLGGIGGGMVSGVGLGGSAPTSAAASSSTCGMQANNSNSMGMGEQMSICGLSDGSTMMGLGGMGESAMTTAGSDSFGAPGDILDLFNIDDYKMSWGEGDFAV
ncbi:myocardin-related transcription factor B [Bactrocera neohumeralis]|uniref:myocardin-related transcription factor B n=1 Tax=Bactrocera neohumeralis TaxID=98809 RepID=UPI002165B2DE|nr:myocardin-related transcription factor B [Bactrocera neohumeralis]